MTIKDTIDTYRKRRNQLTPLLIGIIALLLVVIGILIVIISTGGGKGGFNPFASRTPTQTITFTPTVTPLPSNTPTITTTPADTATETPSAPYLYTVQQGDTLFKIVQDKNLGVNGIPLILMLNPYDPKNTAQPGINPSAQTIYAGQKIWLPNPGATFPTATPWPTNAPPGTRITYFVLPGDSLGGIAAKLRSTVDQIVALNKTVLTKGVNTVLYPGWLLVVPVNLVTVTPEPSRTLTRTPTHTPTYTETPTK